MRGSDFVHLHCHSTYSLLEALPSPEEIVLRAKELGGKACGIADKGYTYGLIEFVESTQQHGLKPILGMETYLAPHTRHNHEDIEGKSTPLVLLAETTEGYKNLLKLGSFAALEGMLDVPRVDCELLQKYGKGLIALTGPIQGAIPQAALAEDRERVKELLETFWECFGKGNVYFELMDLPDVPGQREVNAALIQFGKEWGTPVIATCNSHYCRREDADAHDVLLCIRNNARINDAGRFSLSDVDLSMRPIEELEQAFAHVPEALKNTKVIAERCTIEFEESPTHIPRFPVPKGETEAGYLRKLCEEGLRKRYGAHPTKEQHERLEHERRVIEQMGFSGYFLIVWDIVSEAKRRGITVGPGRGSAAGSMVSYCLDITTLDPLEHGLIFERFLNPERISMPDIDTDFADTRRDEVLEYVRERYGSENVVQICTFGTLAARAAVKDVGRVYGVPFLEMNALAKLIPERPGTLLAEALQTDELRAAYEGNELYRKIIDAALKLEGKARHVSVHACGVIITPKPSMGYTALQRAPKDERTIITQYSAKPLESLGLLKMDLLGLTNLTVIQTALEIIQRTRRERIEMRTIPLNDRKTFELLKRGDTTGVFQLESAGMRRYLKELRPTTFRDITAMAALYRPGPMEWIPHYIRRKHGEEKVEELHEDLREIFAETYGIGVYQEQILELAKKFAGFTLGEADILRKAIGKKIKEELDAQEEKFIQGAMRKGYQRKLAEKIFTDVVLPFAGYGFPKAHAASYARIAYETAYLKAHHPVEFMAALLSSDAEKTDRVLIEIDECRSMGISILPPDINESLRHFTVVHAPQDGGSIRFGLAAIKGIGESTVSAIIEERERKGKFASLEDFVRRMPQKLINKKCIESLAKSGALDCFGERRTFTEHYDLIANYRRACGDAGQGQTDLFGMTGEGIEVATIVFPLTPPASPQQKLSWEKETLGLYVSSHPLGGLRKYIGKKAQLVSSLSSRDVGRRITLAGILEDSKRIRTKKGETMAILTVEDPTGKIEVTLFPRILAECKDILEQPDTVLVIGGILDYRGGGLQLRAEALKRASLSTMLENAKKEGFFDEEEAKCGIPLHRRPEGIEREVIEAVDEEGNVIAGETMVLGNGNGEGEFLGPLSKWILDGMEIAEQLQALGLQEGEQRGQGGAAKNYELKTKNSEEAPSPIASRISIHTVELPPQAPRQMLLDIKKVFETFPGKEKVQLKVGQQLVPLPLTISMSTILQKKLDDVLKKYKTLEVKN